MKILAIALFSIGVINAKPSGGFSSSSRSFSSSSSSRSSPAPSRPSTPSTSSWSSSSKPSVAPPPKSTSSWSSSSSSKPSSSATSSSTSTPSKSWLTKPQTSTRPNSSVERQRYESAVKSGKTFTTREAAVADFKAKEAPKYSSKFTAEPSKRPDHIPSNYRGTDGKTYNITYNQQGGGYGYYSGGGPGLGTFMLYDLASDAIMMETVARRSNNYYIGNPPPATVTVQTGSSIGFLGWILILSGIGLVVFIIIAVAKSL